jgi:hypothetical protein
MSDYEKKRLEMELKNFTSRNFERPSDCRNLDQIRYYVKELCTKIEEYEIRFNYVPAGAYSLLAQYNLVQNRMLHVEFVTSYPPAINFAKAPSTKAA